MLTGLAAIFAFLSSSFLCTPVYMHAQEVTVSINDTRLVTVPPDLWAGSSDYDPSCGGYRTLPSGSNVSLSFVGISVTINFFGDTSSPTAAVNLDDGSNIPVNLVTSTSSISDNCAASAVSWSSGLLVPGNHTVEVVLWPLPVIGTPGPLVIAWIPIRDFAYNQTTPSISTSTTTTSTTTTSTTSTTTPQFSSNSDRTSQKRGAIVGAVVGGLAVLILAIFGVLYVRRKRQALRGGSMHHPAMINEDPTVMAEGRPSLPAIISDTRFSHPSFTGGAVLAPLRGGSELRPNPPLLEDSPSPPDSSSSKGVIGHPENSYNTSLPSRTTMPGSSPPHHIHQDPVTPHPVASVPGPPLTPPGAPTASTPTDRRHLSPTQLEAVQRLAERDIPGSTLAVIVESMLHAGDSAAPRAEAGTQRGGGASRVRRGPSTTTSHGSEGPPPGYDYVAD